MSAAKVVKIDCVIVAVAHDEFKNKSSLSTGSFFGKKVLNDKLVLLDVRGMFNGEEAKRKGFCIDDCNSKVIFIS